ncbi:hypothetical protein [Kytococcus sp. Marseille-QA3725]
MKSTKMMAAIGGALLLVLVATVSAAFGLYWLTAAALGLILTAQLVVSMDTNRRVRYLPRRVKSLLQTIKVEAAPARTGKATARSAQGKPGASAPARPAAAPQQDVTGAVRLIQAQYLGRLDRAQSALESAAEDLRSARDDR